MGGQIGSKIDITSQVIMLMDEGKENSLIQALSWPFPQPSPHFPAPISSGMFYSVIQEKLLYILVSLKISPLFLPLVPPVSAWGLNS